jgi:hypothetical protein
MQELYLIRITACHKPWRYSSVVYTTNNRLFDFLKIHKDQLIDEVNWSAYLEVSNEPEEDLDYYDALDEGSEEPNFPIIMLGEVELYTE